MAAKDISVKKRGADKPAITQGDFGYAVPNGGDLDRRGRFYSE